MTCLAFLSEQSEIHTAGSRLSRAVWSGVISTSPSVSGLLLLNCVICVWLFETPWTVAHQAPLSVGFSRQEYWSGLPCPSPGDFLNPGIEPGSPAWQADSLPLNHQGRPSVSETHRISFLGDGDKVWAEVTLFSDQEAAENLLGRIRQLLLPSPLGPGGRLQIENEREGEKDNQKSRQIGEGVELKRQTTMI